MLFVDGWAITGDWLDIDTDLVDESREPYGRERFVLNLEECRHAKESCSRAEYRFDAHERRCSLSLPL